jgi:hypothetical protein
MTVDGSASGRQHEEAVAAEHHGDAYGGTVFSGTGSAMARDPQAAYAQMRASAPAMRVDNAGIVVTTRAGDDRKSSVTPRSTRRS